jgi:putative membrane protein
MSALFAFLHHVAAFSLFAALVAELLLLRDELTVQRARKIQRIDLAFGIAAGAVLVIGLLRVFYFEKGAAYYFHSVPFIAKLSLFALVGLLSIYPTVQFLSWSAALNRGQAPIPNPATLRAIRIALHLELTGVVIIILCAALMARGVGYLA